MASSEFSFIAVKRNLTELQQRKNAFPLLSAVFRSVNAPGFHVLLNWDVLAALRTTPFTLSVVSA